MNIFIVQQQLVNNQSYIVEQRRNGTRVLTQERREDRRTRIVK